MGPIMAIPRDAALYLRWMQKTDDPEWANAYRKAAARLIKQENNLVGVRLARTFLRRRKTAYR
jgi:hypothetical protein